MNGVNNTSSSSASNVNPIVFTVQEDVFKVPIMYSKN